MPSKLKKPASKAGCYYKSLAQFIQALHLEVACSQGESSHFCSNKSQIHKPQHVFPHLCLNALVISSVSTQYNGVQVKANFDTDSLDFGVDIHCSACISDVKKHFVGDWEKTNKNIKGYNGTRVYNIWKSTIYWPLEDDNGAVETFLFCNS